MTTKRLLGSAPSQVSRNRDLGTMAFQDSSNYYPTTSASGFRNKIINGNFDVWQRGTSFTNANTWTADRWRTYALSASSTITQQTFAVGEVPFAGAGSYYLRFTPTVDSNASDRYVSTNIEDWRQFDSKTVTISFWYRNTATIEGQGIQLRFKRTSGIYDSYGDISLPGLEVTSSWKYYTATVKCPSLSGQAFTSSSYVEFGLYHQRVAATGNIDFACVQIEEGPIATPFERRPYALELNLCKRYCEVWRYDGTSTNDRYVSGSGWSDQVIFKLEVEKRSTPSVTVAGSAELRDGANNAKAITATAANKYSIQLGVQPATLTNYIANLRMATGSTDAIIIAAELS